MRAYTALPWSSARIGQRKCWHAHRKPANRNRLYSTERHRNSASPIVSENTTAQPSSFTVNPDSKTVTTAVGDLPLSPVMDPSYWEATTRHQAPKAKRGKAQNSLERQFRKNPFAQALATPIRQCTASKARLPAFFLQDFSLIAHPETGKPWWIPRSLVWEPAEPQQANETNAELSTSIQDVSEGHTDLETGRGGVDSRETALDVEPSTSTLSKNPKLYGPSAYVVARRDLISAFTMKASGYEKQAKGLFGGVSSRYSRFASKAVWREDMSSFILSRIRQGIVEDLLYLSNLCVDDSRHYIIKCHGWDDVQSKREGAILWLGNTAEPNQAPNPDIQPGPFAIYNIAKDNRTTSLAVHNLPMLLGTEDIAKVRQEAAVLADGSLFVLAGRRTANLQVKLWRLQGYLADHII
ncbi:putative esterase-like protein [Rosellinia necatrix]|uniref:Putative esterase-like protein n=1 Tax=Rosellinia necatrix TaxID=77044 RepID=A0A1W2TVG6_ROSNE|nr:putative esterase-like protein [Rosellinia necatrix]